MVGDGELLDCWVWGWVWCVVVWLDDVNCVYDLSWGVFLWLSKGVVWDVGRCGFCGVVRVWWGCGLFLCECVGGVWVEVFFVEFGWVFKCVFGVWVWGLVFG